MTKKIIYTFMTVILLITFFFGISLSNNSYSYSPSVVYNNDTEFLGPPWQTQPTDYTKYQYNLELIDIFRAWEIETGQETITVAVIDSGIDTNHDEFVGRISELSYNAYSDQVGIQYVEDDLGHGTNVAGIIAAERNNNLGIDGITDNVQLMIIKVNEPGQDVYSNTAIVRGIYYAVDNGAHVINLSLGSSTPSSTIKKAVDYAFENNVFVVAAAGNDGTNEPFYPAAFENVISVGAVDTNSSLASFSNYGSTIDLVAPGVSIYTTNITNNYTVKSGTSFAAPHVAAVLALLLSSGNISYEEIRERIFFTSIDLGEPGKDEYYGNGLLNAYFSLITDLVKIDFETDGEDQFESIWIEHNSNYIVEETPSKEHYIFDGWYLESSLINKLSESFVFTEDIILYAKFIPKYYQVTLKIGDDVFSEFLIQSGNFLNDLPTPEKDNSSFLGWYYNPELTNKYNNEIITDNITLFAKFGSYLYVITFLDADGEILSEIYINSEEDIILPNPPEKASDSLFRYEFISWSNNLENIDSDLVLTPIYKKTLFFENALLELGIDTISINQPWFDQGITLVDNSLYYLVSESVDITKIGTYEVVYNIYHEDELVLIIKRMVHVIPEKINVQITVNKSVTTIVIGQNYIESGADSNYGSVEIIGNVNTQVVGVYAITYRVEYNGKIYEKDKYVYVIESDFSFSNTDIIWYVKVGEDDE